MHLRIRKKGVGGKQGNEVREQVPGFNRAWETSTRRLDYVLIAVGANGGFLASVRLEPISICKDCSCRGVEHVGGGCAPSQQQGALWGGDCRVQKREGGDLAEMFTVEEKRHRQIGDMFLRSKAF